MLLCDSLGRARVVEMPHLWAGEHVVVTSIVNHVVQQLEVCLCKNGEYWEVLLALGGILATHPQALNVLDSIIKQLRDNYKQLPDPHRRFYRHLHEILILKLYSLSGDELHAMQARGCSGRLLLFFLLVRFFIPFVSNPSFSKRIAPS